MATTRRKTGNLGVALAAAAMLVLQGFLGAFAVGTANASPMLDAFGNPLCITSVESHQTDTGHVDHTAMPDCCTVACGMFAPAASAGGSGHSLENALSTTAARLQTRDAVSGYTDEPQRGPGSPRSPPLTM